MADRSGRVAILAAISVAAVVGTAVWGWALYPERIARWVFMAAWLPVLWGYVEWAQVRGNDHATGRAIMILHRSVIAWAGLVLALRVTPRLAVASELLEPSAAQVGLRLSGLAVGVGLMVFGNYLPKFASPWTVTAEPFDWQRVHRFSGWVFLAGGTVVMAASLLLPLGAAGRVSQALLPAIAVLAVGRKFISLATHDRRSLPSETR